MGYDTTHTPIETLTRGKLRVPRGQSLPADIWERRHRRIKQLLWLHALAIPVLATLAGDDAVHAASHGAALAGIALLTKLSRDRRFRGAVASVGLLTASALVVHMSGGATEAHFHFFLTISVLTLYEDWIPFLLAVAYVGLHHTVIGSVAPHEV